MFLVMTVRTVTERLAQAEYPATTERLRAEYGDLRLEYPEGGERLADVLSQTGDDEFADATEAVHAVLGAVGQDAVGRVGYTDRDPDPMGVDGAEQVSF